jgi:hypothetical protein
MNLPEKNLYQQIHPARLTADWATGLYACYLLWQQELVTAMIVAFIPSPHYFADHRAVRRS